MAGRISAACWAASLAMGWALASPAQAAVPLSVACSDGVKNCAKALDGSFPTLGEEWTLNTAWWTGTEATVTYDFGSVVSLTDFTVSLDNNDSYRLSGSVDGGRWSLLTEVMSDHGSVGWGMDTFAGSVPPTALRYVRIQAFDGDDMYSVGEFTAQAAAVPEPEPGTWALMAGGLALAAALRRRAGR